MTIENHESELRDLIARSNQDIAELKLEVKEIKAEFRKELSKLKALFYSILIAICCTFMAVIGNLMVMVLKQG